MKTLWTSCLLVIVPLLLVGCSRSVSFKADVFPIFQSRCASCHKPGGAGYAASGFDVENYKTIMRGTRFGSVINPGSSLDSTLVLLVEHRADPSINMPHQQQRLSKRQVELIKKWIDQGAKDN